MTQERPPSSLPSGYDLRRRLPLMGAVLAGGIATILALVYWLGVAVPARQAADGYNDADRIYAQVMAEHNAQAVELASLAPHRSENAQVLRLAHDVGTTSAEQTDALAVWLRDRTIPVPGSATVALALVESGGLRGAGDDRDDDGSGPRPPAGLNHVHGTATDHGMLTPEEVTQLARLRGAEFDTALVDALIAHHNGGLRPADDEVTGGMDTEATAHADAERQRIRAEVEELLALSAGL
ncbi:DUF305 domain-containing protein [Myceligenerans indicum]|uniref:DUF305 domain-containing protein n=1 Tax=Myceligenerans indicum TaxID=2593663 RepID=A0ABS1LP05_9MICO|nr:DUF305 domain-containing protein [Myceligenerans indicum]MBL0887824.1 DUF305 domain-containing protein [Myceligenerans indicum]